MKKSESPNSESSATTPSGVPTATPQGGKQLDTKLGGHDANQGAKVGGDLGKILDGFRKKTTGDEWDNLQPCDPLGRITTAKSGTFCNSPDYPLNTICVKNLPADFCNSVRPTAPSPPGYEHAFLFHNPNKKAGAHSTTTTTSVTETNVEIKDSAIDNAGAFKGTKAKGAAKLLSTSAEKDIVVPDDGDPCCNRFSCAGHVGKPWCITPMALYRYEHTHPTAQLPLKCDASGGRCAWLQTHFPAKVPQAAMYAFTDVMPSTLPVAHDHALSTIGHHMQW